MKRMLCFLILLGITSPWGRLPAQLTLPEGFEEPIRREEPDADRQEDPEPMDEGMKRMMEQMTVRGLRRQDAEPPGESWNRLLEQMKQRFRSGNLRIRARITLADGSRVTGDLRNSSLFVRNSVGDFPMQMHEIEHMRPIEGSEGVFRFELRGGDVLSGKPSLSVLSLALADGGGRMIRISHVLSLILDTDTI